jgi:hypothetical protein
MRWNKSKEQELIALWKTGLTFQKIGEEIGINRMSVAGKLSRLGMRRKLKSAWAGELSLHEKKGDWEKRGNFSFCQWLEDGKFCHAEISLKQSFAFCDEHLTKVKRKGGGNNDNF